jgi:regulator of protease activity HflC (stomatin/prohibitin superfamily)
MLDKLLDFIITFINDILPFKIVDQWEQGVHLRFGKFHKVVYPGLNCKIPFFDQVWVVPVITQTVNLKPQTVTTLDEKSVVLTSIVRYHIEDVEKFLLGDGGCKGSLVSVISLVSLLQPKLTHFHLRQLYLLVLEVCIQVA